MFRSGLILAIRHQQCSHTGKATKKNLARISTKLFEVDIKENEGIDRRWDQCRLARETFSIRHKLGRNRKGLFERDLECDKTTLGYSSVSSSLPKE